MYSHQTGTRGVFSSTFEVGSLRGVRTSHCIEGWIVNVSIISHGKFRLIEKDCSGTVAGGVTHNQENKHGEFVALHSDEMNLPWRSVRLTSSQLRRALFTSSDVWAKKNRERKPIVFTKSSAPPISVWNGMKITELARITARPMEDIFEAIGFAGYSDVHLKVQDELPAEDLKKIARLLGFTARIIPAPKAQLEKTVKQGVICDAVRQPPPPASQLRPRRPVVAVMGHVDHGKTTLLDSLRNSHVVDDEFGGITQHIGAFSVRVPQCKQGAITFLDTPGHAAFSAMRARGANVTDMVVLVVAADDGVMEQTVESIRFANEAQVPIIVALNKMDKPGVDPEHAKKGLLTYGIQCDAEGGDIQFVPISALKGDGLEELLEAIVLQGELLELQTSFEGLAEGFVIESQTHEHRGKLCTLLVDRGTLRRGSVVVAGTAWCKVRSIFDEWGKPLPKVEPGCAAQVTGWRSLPGAGDLALQVESEQRAREVVQFREENLKADKLQSVSKIIDEKVAKERQDYIAKRDAGRAQGYIALKWNKGKRAKEFEEDDRPALHIVVKGDTDGSVEALLDILETYDRQDDCRLDVLHYGVGPVTLSDVELAQVFNGVVYAMHVGVHPEAKAAAKKEDVKEFKIIYKLVEDIRAEIGNRLPMVDAEEVVGEAKVLQEFLINDKRKKLPVAGCRCVKGDLLKSESFKLIRNGEVIHCGNLVSMKHLKNEVRSIKTNVECGLMFEDQSVRYQEHDVILCVRRFKVNQSTAWTPRGF